MGMARVTHIPRQIVAAIDWWAVWKNDTDIHVDRVVVWCIGEFRDYDRDGEHITPGVSGYVTGEMTLEAAERTGGFVGYVYASNGAAALAEGKKMIEQYKLV